MTCTHTGTAALGDYSNTATVTGDGPGPKGPTTVTASDTSGYVGYTSGLALTKQICTAADVSSCDPADDSVWGETTKVTAGSTVTWRLTVTNTGTAALAPVVVSDPAVPTCSTSMDVLPAGGVHRFTCSGPVSAALVKHRYRDRSAGDRCRNTHPQSGNGWRSAADSGVDSAEVAVPVPAPTDVGGDSGTLPETGSDLAGQLAAAFGLVLLGSVIWAVTRRRTRPV